jgi:hypothetical protein
MKKLILLIVIAGCVDATGCTHAPPVVNNVVSAVIDCSLPKVHDLALQLIPTVETIVAKRGDGWEQDLTDLVKADLEDAVACAVRAVADEAFHAAQASPSDALSDVKSKRATAWMTQRGYKFTDGP